MNTRNPLLLLALSLALAACGSKPEHARADLVIRNADVRTQDPATPSASALAVRSKPIV